MNKEFLEKQYDRFITQVRSEIDGLYRLYNFFFAIESAIFVTIFSGKIAADYLLVAKVTGIILSFYWFFLIRKQRLWRDSWIRRIRAIEQELGYDDFQMWPDRETSIKDVFLKKNKLWNWLLFLPILFLVIWAYLLVI